MTEYRLFDPADPPAFFTDSWYETREHAPHLEQAAHATRLQDAARCVVESVRAAPDEIQSVVDLGAGDGGLLSLVEAQVTVPCWGYDLMAVNVDYGCQVRGVQLELRNFGTDEVNWGDLAVITECLEHLPDPHATVRQIAEHSRWIVASSPVNEDDTQHDACHAWAWDLEGYAALVEQGGFTVQEQFVSDPNGYGFQAVVGRR